MAKTKPLTTAITHAHLERVEVRGFGLAADSSGPRVAGDRRRGRHRRWWPRCRRYAGAACR